METLKQAYINDKPTSFSYKKKYLIYYGFNLIDEVGQFAGKLYGFGWSLQGEYVLIQEKGKHYAIYFEDISL